MSVDQLKNPQSSKHNNSKTSPKRKASCDINSLRASNISNFRGSINTTDYLGLGSLLNNSNRRTSTSIDNPFLIPTRTMDGPGSSTLNNTTTNNEGGYSRRASVTSTGSFGGLTCMSGFTSDMLVESLSQLDSNNNNRNNWQQNDLSSSVNMMQPPPANLNSSAGFNNSGSLTGSATQALNFNNSINPASSLLPPLDPSAAAMQQHVLSTLGSIGLNMFANVASSVADTNGGAKGGVKGEEEDKKKAAASRNNNEQSSIKTSESTDTNKLDVHQNAAQQQLAYIQQLQEVQVQQQMEAQKQRRTMNDIALTSAAQQGGDEGSIANTIMEIMNRPTGYNSSKTTKPSSSNRRRRSRDRGDADSYSGSTGSMNDGMFGLSGNKSVASGTQTLLDAAELMNDEADISPVLGDGKPILKSSSNHHQQQQQQIGCAHLSVLKYISLTSPSDTSGSHLRANYALSFGGLFELPSIPTDEEYCSRFDKSLEPYQLPKFDVAALQAARFAELALGALVDSSSSSNNSTLVVELTNASVLCLRDCIEERVHPSLMFDMARSFFFHAILRLYLDKDMIYYFKFRRVCLRHLCQLDGYPGVSKLIAAISFQDSLVYMICNGADEDDLPNIDGDIPRAVPPHPHSGMAKSTAEKKFGVSISPSRVASIDINQMWIQGTPPVFINEDAPVKSRVIDGLACAIRTSLDEAKALQTKEEPQQSSRGRIISRKKKYAEDSKDKSATQWAVEHYPNELSNSNIVHETTSLLQADKEATFSLFRGHDLLTVALESIVNSDRDVKYVPGQSILNILEGIIDRPILLYQGGPTYHIITNCAILLAHKINKLHSTVIKDHNECLKEQYDTALDIYNMARLVLEKHRSKLPLRLQCHEVPSVSATANESGLLIDLSNMTMCTSYNCLDCVAMGGISVKKEDDKGLSDSVSSSGRKRKAPELFVARPSKSGLGVQDGDEKFLAGKSLTSPDRDKKQRTNEGVSVGRSRGGQITEPERELDINDQALMAALSRTISQKER